MNKITINLIKIQDDNTNQSKLTPTFNRNRQRKHINMGTTIIVYKCCTKLIYILIEENTVFLLNNSQVQNVNKVAILKCIYPVVN